jgi:hypothetical protein
MHRILLSALVLLLVGTAPTISAQPIPNIWTGNGPFATGQGDNVVQALAVSPDGMTVYSGTGSGTLFTYDYGFMLHVTITGNGNGLVSDDTGGINCASGSVTACSDTYLHDTTVLLTPTTTTTSSTFSGWTSPDCSGYSTCTVAMLNNKIIDAGFGLGPKGSGPMARIVSGNGFDSISNAYDAAGQNTVIQAVTGPHSVGALTLDNGTTVTLKGGYDAAFQTPDQPSILQGTLKVQSGILRVNNVKVMKAP